MAPKTVVVGGGASKSATSALHEVLVDALRLWRRPESDENPIVTFPALDFVCVILRSFLSSQNHFEAAPSRG